MYKITLICPVNATNSNWKDLAMVIKIKRIDN